MAYENPGKLFSDRYGIVETPEDITEYAAFLRREAGLSADPPIDLSRVYSRFGVPCPGRVSLGNVPGMLVDPERGVILVNENDPRKRRRFTEAHELIELVFEELPDVNRWNINQRGNFKYHAKENLCNCGAAELLMPRETFLQHIITHGCSFDTARELADLYDVSMTAALIQSARMSKDDCVVVMFRNKNKPSEIRQKTSEHQLPLFGDASELLPPSKLRVQWSMGDMFVPNDKSVPEDSSIWSAWKNGVCASGYDNLDLGSIQGIFHCESLPFTCESDCIWVLSLLSRQDGLQRI